MKNICTSIWQKCAKLITSSVFLFILLFSIQSINAATITSASSGNWSASAWPNTIRTGKITSSITSSNLIGIATKFTTEISIGNIIKTTGNIVIGTVLSITDDTHLTLSGNALSTNTIINYNSQGVGSVDVVTINNSYTVTVDVSNAVCASLTIQRVSAGINGTTTLGFNANQQLTVSGTVTMTGGATNKEAKLDMTNGGTLICKGLALNSNIIFIPGTGTVVFTVDNTLSSKITLLNNLIIRGGTTTTNAGLTFTGDIVVENGGGFYAGNTITLKGDFTNNGAFTANSETVIFTSNSPQAIGGSAQTSFYNFTVANNGSNDGITNIVSVNKSITITHALTLTSGIIKTSDAASLELAKNATSTVGSDNRFVWGPITKIGKNAFTFPVGDITQSKRIVWAPITISAPQNDADKFTCTYFYSAAANSSTICSGSDITNVSTLEYWNLNRAAGNSTPKVTLNWKDGTRSGIEVVSDLVIAHWNGSCWESKGGVISGNANAGTILSNVAFTLYSPITFGSKKNSNPLPIQLVSFDASCGSNGVDLAWVTATETNNDYFTIERSPDAKNWGVVTTVNGAGNSNMIINYSTTDANAIRGTSYYRLKQTDFDGKSETFSPVSVVCSTGAEQALVSYYPNPFVSVVTVDLKNLTTDTGLISVYDIYGNKVFTKTVSSTELDSKSFPMNLSQLAAGIYTIEFRSSAYSSSGKIVKN
ncbi:MAG: T9SS type A sorting domain-containing protein [Bacteroidota bacterium]